MKIINRILTFTSLFLFSFVMAACGKSENSSYSSVYKESESVSPISSESSTEEISSSITIEDDRIENFSLHFIDYEQYFDYLNNPVSDYFVNASDMITGKEYVLIMNCDYDGGDINSSVVNFYIDADGLYFEDFLSASSSKVSVNGNGNEAVISFTNVSKDSKTLSCELLLFTLKNYNLSISWGSENTVADSIYSLNNPVKEGCDFEYERLEDGTFALTKYSGKSTEVTVPDFVECISYTAFKGNTTVTSITIPDSVTEIQSGAFAGCTNLTDITLPFIGENADNKQFLGYIFGAGYYYENNRYVPSSLKKVIIGESCKSIASNAFYSCVYLTDIFISGNVASIGKNAIYDCDSLSNLIIDENNKVYDSRNNCNAIIETKTNTLIEGCNKTVIPDGVEKISSEAFKDCTELTDIRIPDSVTVIQKSAFSGCNSVSGITLPFVGESASDNQYLGHLFGAYSYLENPKYVPSSLKKVILSDKCESIGNYAFYNCSNITDVNISESVLSIGISSFECCEGITSLIIPKNVCTIEDSSFKNCANIISIEVDSNNQTYTSGNNCNAIISRLSNELLAGCNNSVIPEGIKTIGPYAFYNCNKLTNITIPESVTNIYDGAFRNCSGLTSIIVDSNNQTYTSEDNCNAIIKKSTSALILGCINTVIPDDVRCIGSYAFGNCTFTSFTIPDFVTEVQASAFEGCNNLESITLPFVGGSADENQYLGYIFGASNYSENVTYVPASLKEVIISEKCTSIGKAAFYECNNLESITIPYIGENTTDNQYLGYMFGASDYSENADYVPASLKEVTISEKCTFISDYYFSECLYLTNIIIPDSVINIGNYAFSGCSGLTSITIPDSVTSIGEAAFSGCSALESITLPFTGDKEHSSKDNYQYPFGYIFGTISYDGGTATRQSYIGNSIASSENSTYYIPSSLKEVIITGSTYIPYGTFYNCDSLTSITIPNSITDISNDAFYGCSSLTGITIPDSVTGIGSYAFRNCSSLTSIKVDENNSYYDSRNNCNAIIKTNKNILIVGCSSSIIPQDITAIGENAFYGCSSLTSIILPDSIISIRDSAFCDCTGLTNIITSNSVITIGINAFTGCSSLTSITIPDSVTNIGDYAFNDCDSLISVIISDNVTSIGKSAFKNCSRLSSITLPFVGESATDNQYLGFIFGASSYSGNATYVPASLKNITISDSCTSIAKFAFYGCNNMESITLPFVGENATDNQYLGYIFGASDYSENATYVPASLKEVIIENKCTNISSYSFSECTNLTSITIPDSVTSIGSQAFHNCNSLSSINFSGTISQWNAVTKDTDWEPSCDYVIYCSDGNI